MQPFLVASGECNLFLLHMTNATFFGCISQIKDIEKISEIYFVDLIGDAASSEACLLVEKTRVEDVSGILIAGAEVKVAVFREHFMYKIMHEVGQSTIFSSTFRCSNVLAMGY